MKTQDQNSVKPDTQSCQMAVSGSVTVSELRIGNFLYKCYPDGKETTIVEKISKHFMNGFGISAIEPIILSEEWLLKLGATEEMLGHFLLDRFQLIWKESYNYWYVIDRYNACYYSKVEFVHEWQNLYFALNGSDLTLGCLTDR